MAAEIVSFLLNDREVVIVAKPLDHTTECTARPARLYGHQGRLFPGRLWQLHRARGWRADGFLPAARQGYRRP